MNTKPFMIQPQREHEKFQREIFCTRNKSGGKIAILILNPLSLFRINLISNPKQVKRFFAEGIIK
jgi:hypothetical protein